MAIGKNYDQPVDLMSNPFSGHVGDGPKNSALRKIILRHASTFDELLRALLLASWGHWVESFAPGDQFSQSLLREPHVINQLQDKYGISVWEWLDNYNKPPPIEVFQYWCKFVFWMLWPSLNWLLDGLRPSDFNIIIGNEIWLTPTTQQLLAFTRTETRYAPLLWQYWITPRRNHPDFHQKWVWSAWAYHITFSFNPMLINVSSTKRRSSGRRTPQSSIPQVFGKEDLIIFKIQSAIKHTCSYRAKNIWIQSQLSLVKQRRSTVAQLNP